MGVFMSLALAGFCKTTYIPTYDNRLIIIENGEVNTSENQQHMLEYASQDGLITCYINQQVVSEDLVRAIKKAKNKAGWDMVAASVLTVTTGVSEMQGYLGHGSNYNTLYYVDSRDDARESSAAAGNANSRVESLKTLLVDLVVRNNSEKEMLITDMDRGLMWFILPHNEAVVSLLKNQECHFRISSCSPLDENVKYINVTGNNTLEKYTVAMETEQYWYVPLNEKDARKLRFETNEKEGYVRIDKETLSMNYIDKNSFMSLSDKSMK